MKLYFLRHGIAVAREEWAGDEASRPLTDKGRRRLEDVGEFLAGRKLGVERVLTSPLVRCTQTAEVVAQRMKAVDRVAVDERLAPGFGPGMLARLLRSHAETGALMLVGHEPDFSLTIGHVIGGGRVVCDKGGVACVHLPNPREMEGELEWLLAPGLLHD